MRFFRNEFSGEIVDIEPTASGKVPLVFKGGSWVPYQGTMPVGEDWASISPEEVKRLTTS
jgi:hypothetical protein